MLAAAAGTEVSIAGVDFQSGDSQNFDSVLERLNRLSVTRSFVPQIDVDWSQTTTRDEFAALYPAWSLLHGTGADTGLDESGRIRFAQYQQMNLMLFTALLERHAIGSLARAYDLNPAEQFSEYVGHFIKEEIYHTMLFQRAIRQIHAGMEGASPLPSRQLDLATRLLFGLVNLFPGERLRSIFTFTILRFAEQVTIYAHQVAQSVVPRRESLVAQVWAFHALDESRHLAFDAMILERNRLPGILQWLPRLVALPACAVLSLLLNANEIWAARQLGVNVHVWQIPWLMRRTRAPFKQRVFALLANTLKGRTDEGSA